MEPAAWGPQGNLATAFGHVRVPRSASECHAVCAQPLERETERSADQGRSGAAGGAAAHQPEAHLEQDLSSSGCLEEAVQQPDRRNRRDALRGQVARDHLVHLPTREAAPSTQCEAGVRDCAGASSGSRQPEFTRRPPHPRCGMSSSPTLGIGGEAARSESKQGGPEGAPRISARCIRGGAEVRLVRRSERPPPPPASQRWGPDCTCVCR